MAQLNISQVARRWGKSRQTIYNYLSEGKLSGENDREGNTVIDSSEMIRVFGEPQAKSKTSNVPNTVQGELVELRQLVEIEKLKRTHAEERKQDLERQVSELKDTIEALKVENTRQGERLETALKTLDKSLDKSLPSPKKPLLEQISGLWKK